MKSLRVAAFQREPLFGDIGGTIERLLTDLAWCDHQGVQLAVFPECYLQGYATDRRTIVRRALPIDGEVLDTLFAKLARFQTDIVLGLIEKRGIAFHNTAAVIRQGRVIGTYAKCHTNERGFDAGCESPVFEAAGWRFGVNICYDANFPDAAAKLRQQGAQLICYPLNNMLAPATAAKWRSKSIENLQYRAKETGCWVVSSDVVGQHNNQLSYGCTCIVHPDGMIVQQAPERTEHVILYNLT